MKRVYLLGVSLLSVAVLFIGIPASSRAASNLHVTLNAPPSVGYVITGYANMDDDGNNQDYVCVICRNDNGTINDVDTGLHFPVGNPINATGGCNGNSNPGTPTSIEIYDTTSSFPGPGNEDSNGGVDAAAFCQSSASQPPSPSSGGSKSVDAPPRPGPDMIDLPEWAVVGTFTQMTPLYYDPAQGATSDSTMDSGQSLWVLGLDDTGAFYQVVLSGQYLWVPVGTIGPTYSAPWNGYPLPTEVVGA
jgi:hypothetical protein